MTLDDEFKPTNFLSIRVSHLDHQQSSMTGPASNKSLDAGDIELALQTRNHLDHQQSSL